MKKDTIGVWFSCGAASAVAAKMTIEQYSKTHNIKILNNPIKEEDSDNRRFLKDVEKWLGVEVEIVKSSKFPDCSAVTVWKKRKFMSAINGAPCTYELKRKARQEYERENRLDSYVMGFTHEEVSRHDDFLTREITPLIPVLIDNKITKKDCYSVLNEAGIDLPRIYKQGYPNANCIGCVKATSPTYWNHVRKMHPAIFDQRATQSRQIGAKLVRVKSKRIFLDELDPLALGRPMKNMDFECGLFCGK